MVEWHYIYSISLFDEYWDLIEEKLLNIWEKPKAIFDVSYLDDFEIRTKCNLDWLWSSWLIKNN
jgi:desulfoferrodoxin (superoxide reductase-like protein)